MTLPQTARQCLRKYANFSGRATRAEFWWWYLAMSLVLMGLAIIDGIINMAFLALSIGIIIPLSLLVGVAIVLPFLTVTSRRLHDIGRSGWWQVAWYAIDIVASLVFLVAWVFVFILLLGGTTNGSNEVEGSNGGTSLPVWVPLLAAALVSSGTIIAVYVWALLWLVRPGQPGPNRFGSDPRAWDDEDVATAETPS